MTRRALWIGVAGAAGVIAPVALAAEGTASAYEMICYTARRVCYELPGNGTMTVYGYDTNGNWWVIRTF